MAALIAKAAAQREDSATALERSHWA